MKNMRGQSAVEYLTTYGWAILLLVIVVGALMMSGALNPSYFMSEECYLGPNLPCAFQLYTATGGNQMLALEMANGFPYKIGITKIELFDPDTGDSLVKDLTLRTLVSGETLKLSGTASAPNAGPALDLGPDGAKPNTLNKYRVAITYYSCAPEVTADCTQTNQDLIHTLNGRILGRLITQK